MGLNNVTNYMLDNLLNGFYDVKKCKLEDNCIVEEKGNTIHLITIINKVKRTFT